MKENDLGVVTCSTLPSAADSNSEGWTRIVRKRRGLRSPLYHLLFLFNTTADYLPSLRPPARLGPSTLPPPTESAAIYNTNKIGEKYSLCASVQMSTWKGTNQGHCCNRPPGMKVVLIMLESAVLLKEIIKTSDHSAALVVVPQVVVCHNSKDVGCPFMCTPYLVAPGFFLFTFFSQDEPLICRFGASDYLSSRYGYFRCLG